YPSPGRLPHSVSAAGDHRLRWRRPTPRGTCARSPTPRSRPNSATRRGWAATSGCCSRWASRSRWSWRPPRMARVGTEQGALREVIAGTGTGVAATDMVLNIGPQHPSTHGVLRLRLTLDGDRVVAADPIVGYMHRGAEKLFEVRDYRQII